MAKTNTKVNGFSFAKQPMRNSTTKSTIALTTSFILI